MSFYIPSQSEILNVSRSRGADSRNPGLWRGLVGAWPLQEPGGLTAYDLSGYKNNGTLTNMDAATNHVVTPMGRALDFDGSNDTLLLQTMIPTAYPFTLAVWAKPLSTRTSSTEFFLATDNSGATGNWHAIGKNATTLAGFAGSNDAGSSVRSTGGVMASNVWSHIVGIWLSATSRQVFVNGIAAVVNTTSKVPTGLNRSLMGYGSVVAFGGGISNVCAWNRPLPPSEIRSLYTDPWGMYTLRRRVQVRGAAVAGNRRRRLLIAGASR